MNDVDPIAYTIHLEPDLKTFRFFGRTKILMEASGCVNEIILNALELAVWSCKVDLDGRQEGCSFQVDPKSEILKVHLPKKLKGRIELTMEYEGRIGEGMKGFYRSRYVKGGSIKYLAVTQFEESDARRAFPCFDHPLKKATFDVDMVIDEPLSAISNGPVIQAERLTDGRKLVTFGQTPKMSTYLVCFAVGEFEFIEDPGEILVRVATTPGMSKYARFGLEFGRKALELCEAYYGIKYPLEKLDLIAIGDFAAGAMENWGAITFRENLLLHYPQITSKAGEQRICEVIAHEMAHQWFGDLVSPSDWKYLWLNESFATYFGYGVVHHHYPQWDLWSQFLHGETATALDRDGLHETVSIEIPGGEHVVINASTAPIIYNKGGSILRQVEGHIGSDQFQEGLRQYLKKYAYGCAASHHLWQALEDVSRESITEMMKSWIEQPGYPVVETARDGERIVLNQRRFTYLPNNYGQKWLIPTSVEIFYERGKSRTVKVLLEDEKAVIDLGDNAVAYKINAGQTGFYRVLYRDETNLHALGERILSKALPSDDRWGLQNDLYAFVRGGSIVVEDYLDFLSYYIHEDTFLPLTSIAGNLHHAYLVLDGPQRDKVASVGKSLFEKVLSRIGLEPGSQEEHTTSILRDQIIFQAVQFGSQNAEGFALEKFTSLMGGKPVHPDIMRSVSQVGALNGGEEVFEWFQGRLSASESEHERMIMLAALGSFKSNNMIERAKHYILEEVPDRNKFVPISYLAANPHAMPSMWEWYLSNLEALEQFHPMHYERVIQAIVPLCCIGKEEEAETFFEHYMSQKDKARDVIKLSLEKLKINARMRG